MARIRIEVRNVFNKPVAILDAIEELDGWRFAYAILSDMAKQHNRTMNGCRFCKDTEGRNAVICEGGSAHHVNSEQVRSMNKEKRRWVELGARGLKVPEGGLRTETFEYLLRGGKPAENLPITVVVYPEGARRIVDGRHRIMLARDAGETHVHGVMWEMGARGGRRWSYTGKLPI